MGFVVLNRVVRQGLADELKEMGNKPHRWGGVEGRRWRVCQAKEEQVQKHEGRRVLGIF